MLLKLLFYKLLIECHLTFYMIRLGKNLNPVFNDDLYWASMSKQIK